MVNATLAWHLRRQAQGADAKDGERTRKWNSSSSSKRIRRHASEVRCPGGQPTAGQDRVRQRLSCPCRQYLDQVGRGDRLAEQVTLRFVAAEESEEFRLFLRFHAFGHHLEAQRVRQRNDRGDQSHGVRIVRKLLDE